MDWILNFIPDGLNFDKLWISYFSFDRFILINDLLATCPLIGKSKWISRYIWEYKRWV